MITPTDLRYRSPYQLRVSLVADVLSSNTALEGSDVQQLAIKVLHAIDHIPEKVR